MPQIRAKDGHLYDFPDDPTPEEQAWLQQNQVSVAEDMGKSGLSGLAEGAVRGPLIFGDLLKLGMLGADKVFGSNMAKDGIKLFTLPNGQEIRFDPGSQIAIDILKDAGAQFHEPKTTAGRYSNAVGAALGSSIGGGMLGGVKTLGKVLTKPAITTAGAAGAAAELSGDLSRGFDESKPQNPVAKAAGGVIGGVGSNMARAALSSPAKEEVFRALKDTTPEEWAQAGSNLKTLKNSGSSTYTLADALPPSTGIGGVAKELSNTVGGRSLQRNLGPARDDDINGIMNRLLDEIYPPDSIKTGELNMALSGNAAAEIGRLKGVGRGSRNATLGQNTVPLKDLQNETSQMYMRGFQPGVFGTPRQGAYALGAQQLDPAWMKRVPGFQSSVNPGAPLPFTNNVRALADRVQSFQNVPQGAATNPASALMKGDRVEVGQALDAALRRLSGPYRQAMDDRIQFGESVLAPAQAGVLGRFKDLGSGPSAAPSALHGVTTGELNRALPAIAPTDQLKEQLARIMAENGGLKPIRAGSEGARGAMNQRELTAQILDNLQNKGPAGLGDKFRSDAKAVDMLSSLRAEAGMDSSVKQGLSKSTGSWLSPFSEAARRSRLLASDREVQKIAGLLSKPTPENLQKLQELAKMDPRFARYLGWANVPGQASAAAQTGNRLIMD